MSKVVTVFGATGLQGSSIVQALIKEGKYAVRAVTREPNKPEAQQLQQAGAQVVQADLSNPEDVRKAVEGAWAVFAVTNFWDPSGASKEVELGTSLAVASKAAGVEVYLWSSLPNVEVQSGGKYKVPHFTDKAKVDEVVLSQAFSYTVILLTGWYFTNAQWQCKDDGNGTVTFSLPLAPQNKLAGWDPADMGKVVVAALNDAQGSKAFNGKHVALAGYDEPLSTWLSDFEAASGKKAAHSSASSDGSDDKGTDQWTSKDMFGWIADYGYFGDVDSSTGQQLVGAGALDTWPEWVKSNNFMH